MGAGVFEKGIFMKKFFWVCGSSLLLMMQPASAQDAAMKICGEKWQATKASGATQGATWPKFLAECRSNLPATPAQAEKPAPKPLVDPKQGSKVAGAPVFPVGVSSKFADLRPAQARQKTCSEQYQANKASGGNAGLNWLEKGGGYWSQCNKKLKGV
ncbi:MAG: putative signal peptide protein [Pseudomonadota bacterium]|jgi:hypothetical protein